LRQQAIDRARSQGIRPREEYLSAIAVSEEEQKRKTKERSKRSYLNSPKIQERKIRADAKRMVSDARKAVRSLVKRLKGWKLALPNRDAIYRRMWKLRNPEAVKLQNHQRRMKGRSHKPNSRAHQILSIVKQRQKGKCYWCQQAYGAHPHRDHIWPLALGGSNGPENICFACPSCNLKKGAKTPMEFAGRLL
jgi:5-methylcytosine-specific restriction endonuclease McrA